MVWNLQKIKLLKKDMRCLTDVMGIIDMTVSAKMFTVASWLLSQSASHLVGQFASMLLFAQLDCQLVN